MGILLNRDLISANERAGDTIAEVEAMLPGQAAPKGEVDPRWQAIIKIEEFVREEPEAVWPFIHRWGCHEDEDLRTASATVLPEHLLECHFADFFPKVTAAAKQNALFADTFTRCWKFGQSHEDGNAERFDHLKKACQIQRKHV
jgi:hypothetical protein